MSSMHSNDTGDTGDTRDTGDTGDAHDTGDARDRREPRDPRMPGMSRNPGGTEPPAHQQAWALIPWVVNCSATEAERAMVADHVAACEDCRDELTFQRLLHAQMNAQMNTQMNAVAVAPVDTEAALQRISAALNAEMHSQPAAPPPGLPPRPQRWVRVLAAAVVVQAVGLAALLGVISQRPRPADYQTLSRAEPANAAAVLRLVAAPSMTLGELQALLARSGVAIVETSADGVALGLALQPGTARDTALAALRSAPGVLLAEPVAAPAALRP